MTINKADTPGDTVPCRYCRQPVHRLAKKCQHCMGMLTIRSRVEHLSGKVMGYIGLVMGLLSLFYAAKEGYYYIEERQQNRETLAAYVGAAEQFQQLDSLEYAETALRQAIEIKPNDRALRSRFFFLRTNTILRQTEIYSNRLPDKYTEPIHELVTTGFSLLHSETVPNKRAKMLVYLGWLLNYDRRWSDTDAINTLFEEAYQLAPKSAEVLYWYSQWLISLESEQDRALMLIEQATQLEPDNVLYWRKRGVFQTKTKAFAQAFESFKRAVELGSKQQQLHRIQAANISKSALGKALLEADKIMDITAADFYGLSFEQRTALVDFTLKHYTKDRNFNMLAMRLYHRVGRSADAESLMREINNYGRYSKLNELVLVASILEATGSDPEKLAQIREWIAERAEQEK